MSVALCLCARLTPYAVLLGDTSAAARYEREQAAYTATLHDRHWDESRGLFVVLSGTIEVRRMVGAQSLIVGHAVPGKIIGELSFLG